MREKGTITRKDAANVMRFLMVCYHQGTFDAYRVDDFPYSRQYVEDHKRMLALGVLESDHMKFDEYQYTLLLYARNGHMPSFGANVLMNMNESSMFPYLCERFYMQGVEDFVAKPDILVIESYGESIWQFWNEMSRQEVVKKEVMSRVQEYCLEMKTALELCGDAERSQKIIDLGHTLWLLTRPIGYSVRR